jgi:hypothetical protein
MNARRRFLHHRISIRSLVVSFLASTLALETSQMTIGQGLVITKLTSWAKSHGKQPATSEDKALEQLAANID